VGAMAPTGPSLRAPLAAQWIPLKTISRHAKEVISRTIGQIIIWQHFEDLEPILLYVFVVLTNETDGYDTR